MRRVKRGREGRSVAVVTDARCSSVPRAAAAGWPGVGFVVGDCDSPAQHGAGRPLGRGAGPRLSSGMRLIGVLVLFTPETQPLCDPGALPMGHVGAHTVGAPRERRGTLASSRARRTVVCVLHGELCQLPGRGAQPASSCTYSKELGRTTEAADLTDVVAERGAECVARPPRRPIAGLSSAACHKA